VWIDEIEKGMAGAESSGTMDSGVTKRVFGQLLTWMEERPKDKLIYIIATANEALSLPAALLRRFDALFWVDLPSEADRAEILRIHLSKNNQMSEEVESSMGRLCEVTRGFSGAEIESTVHAAMFKAFNDDSERVTPTHLEDAALTITPIAKLRREDIEISRMWAKERCQFAQDTEPVNLESLHQDRVRMIQSRSINLN
jgi:SpoVK/Ycf46/Vps4 family AAA+-type ATPase